MKPSYSLISSAESPRLTIQSFLKQASRYSSPFDKQILLFPLCAYFLNLDHISDNHADKLHSLFVDVFSLELSREQLLLLKELSY